jgi:hypothetical protein
MNVDERLDTARASLEHATADAAPDPCDLDRRHSRRRTHSVMAASLALVVIGLAGIVPVRSQNRATDSIASRTAPAPALAAPAPVPVVPTSEPAYVLSPTTGWVTVPTGTITADLGSAFVGEEFSQVAVAFDIRQDPLVSYRGSLTQTIRVGVGTYSDELRDIYPGPGTPVTVDGREFEIVEVDRPTFTQSALVPVDLSEPTFLITARGVDTEILTTIADGIDPTATVPRVATATVGFTVIHSGPPEYPTLGAGTAVSYRDPDADDRNFTVTTFDGTPISCFAYAWVYPTTEIAHIGGDTGVIAQLTGTPEGTGTYQALWNLDDDTLIGITATGITRTDLIELADQLTLDGTPTDAYERPLPFALSR